MFGFGLSGLHNEHVLARRGVPVAAQAEVVVGGILLALLPAAIMLSLLSARRRRLRGRLAGVGG
jgi:hypothetical protein